MIFAQILHKKQPIFAQRFVIINLFLQPNENFGDILEVINKKY